MENGKADEPHATDQPKKPEGHRHDSSASKASATSPRRISPRVTKGNFPEEKLVHLQGALSEAAKELKKERKENKLLKEELVDKLVEISKLKTHVKELEGEKKEIEGMKDMVKTLVQNQEDALMKQQMAVGQREQLESELEKIKDAGDDFQKVEMEVLQEVLQACLEESKRKCQDLMLKSLSQKQEIIQYRQRLLSTENELRNMRGEPPLLKLDFGGSSSEIWSKPAALDGLPADDDDGGSGSGAARKAPKSPKHNRRRQDSEPDLSRTLSKAVAEAASSGRSPRRPVTGGASPRRPVTGGASPRPQTVTDTASRHNRARSMSSLPLGQLDKRKPGGKKVSWGRCGSPGEQSVSPAMSPLPQVTNTPGRPGSSPKVKKQN